MIDNLGIFKKRFDIYLTRYLDRKIENISKITTDASILNYINYLKKNSLSGGKRIRPYLAYLIYQTLHGENTSITEDKALEFLVFLEIFHIFCLVHDDIMDKSSLRHGIPTANDYISNYLKEEKRLGNFDHVGNSQAILLGDLLLTWSQEIVNLNKNFPQEIIDNVNAYFYKMVDEVSVGQMIDVDMVTRKSVSKELIDEKTRLKTAGYSFTNPLLIGAALCGKDNDEIKKFCREFGLAMGIAFQTQDDLLDITSSDEKLGKTTSLDKSQNQHTYFTHFPSLEYGKKIIAENFKLAKKLVDKLKVENLYKQKFLDLIEAIKKRSS
jgi:geranylgeranyl diphosphate synthase, type I